VRLTLNVSLKTEEDIEAAIKFFNDTVQWAGWNSWPEHTDMLGTYDCPILIKHKIEEKVDSVEVDTNYKQQRAKDYLTQELKQLLKNNKNNCIHNLLNVLVLGSLLICCH
jgi:hypothetical protein